MELNRLPSFLSYGAPLTRVCSSDEKIVLMVLMENILNSARDLWNIKYLEASQEDNTPIYFMMSVTDFTNSPRLDC